jgi:hypothetical protein
VELNLRLMVRQPMCPGVGPPLGAHDQILHVLSSDMYLLLVGLALCRDDRSVFCSAHHSLVRDAKDP